MPEKSKAIQIGRRFNPGQGNGYIHDAADWVESIVNQSHKTLREIRVVASYAVHFFANLLNINPVLLHIFASICPTQKSILKTIGEILRELRESKGLLLRQVAAAIQIDPTLLSKIETGVRKATKEQIVNLAHFLKQMRKN